MQRPQPLLLEAGFAPQHKAARLTNNNRCSGLPVASTTPAEHSKTARYKGCRQMA